MEADIQDIKKLREETGAGILEIKEALEDAEGDVSKAKEILAEKGAEKAAKKADRAAEDGLVYNYSHPGNKVGSMVLVACETDFVAKTDDFQNLCKEIAMQVAAGEYESVEELLGDDYIREPGKKIKDLVTEATAKLGEKIEVRKLARFAVGE